MLSELVNSEKSDSPYCTLSLYNVQWTCAVYTVYCTVYTVHCTMYAI